VRVQVHASTTHSHMFLSKTKNTLVVLVYVRVRMIARVFLLRSLGCNTRRAWRGFHALEC
jgi:hypothetical protein